MTPNPAQYDPEGLLSMATRAHHAAVAPRLSTMDSATCSAVAGIGIATMGQLPGGAAHHWTAIAIGVLLLAVAAVLYMKARARSGLHGFDATGKRDLIAFGAMTFVLAIGALSGAEANRIVYPIIGGVAALAWFATFRHVAARR